MAAKYAGNWPGYYLAFLAECDADTSDCVIPLYEAAISLKAIRMIELGVRLGISTRALLCAAQSLEGHLWSVDQDPCREAQEYVRQAGLSSFWTFKQQDSRTFLREWSIPGVDLIFIDSGHDYDLTLEEVTLSSRILRPGGSIFLHDTKAPNYPSVMGAVEKFLAAYPGKYSYQELGTRYGLGRVMKL